MSKTFTELWRLDTQGHTLFISVRRNVHAFKLNHHFTLCLFGVWAAKWMQSCGIAGFVSAASLDQSRENKRGSEAMWGGVVGVRTWTNTDRVTGLDGPERITFCRLIKVSFTLQTQAGHNHQLLVSVRHLSRFHAENYHFMPLTLDWWYVLDTKLQQLID